MPSKHPGPRAPTRPPRRGPGVAAASDAVPCSFHTSTAMPRFRAWISPLYTGSVGFWPMKQEMMSVPPVTKAGEMHISEDWDPSLCFPAVSSTEGRPGGAPPPPTGASYPGSSGGGVLGAAPRAG